MIVVVAFAGIDFRLFERELEIPGVARLSPKNYSNGCRFLDWQRVLNQQIRQSAPIGAGDQLEQTRGDC